MIPGPDYPSHPARPARGPIRDRRQSGVARGMGVALLVVILTLAVSWSFAPILSPTDRVLRAVAAATVAALWLAAAIGHVAALRFESPAPRAPAADVDARGTGLDAAEQFRERTVLGLVRQNPLQPA